MSYSQLTRITYYTVLKIVLDFHINTILIIVLDFQCHFISDMMIYLKLKRVLYIAVLCLERGWTFTLVAMT